MAPRQPQVASPIDFNPTPMNGSLILLALGVFASKYLHGGIPVFRYKLKTVLRHEACQESLVSHYRLLTRSNLPHILTIYEMFSFICPVILLKYLHMSLGVHAYIGEFLLWAWKLESFYTGRLDGRVILSFPRSRETKSWCVFNQKRAAGK